MTPSKLNERIRVRAYYLTLNSGLEAVDCLVHRRAHRTGDVRKAERSREARRQGAQGERSPAR